MQVGHGKYYNVLRYGDRCVLKVAQVEHLEASHLLWNEMLAYEKAKDAGLQGTVVATVWEAGLDSTVRAHW